ncbi:MAG: SDR family oxidoreductase [Candidatus Nitrohelix vancouverensis]|uniref:SDR family oxidoreductase n=1 Tax=Candidatus Nitrohelix vancouverensis TaxID=2705534 RepID=A0A7T0G4G8_9BACT|nr:MAG: SDR family oxidoreductase [Candidatus Nitrohelix vancouverensis]
MRLQNKIVIITGGGAGIGRATAIAFSREGASVVLFGRRKDKLEETASWLHGKSLIVQGDMTQEADLDRLVQTTLDAFGSIDILLNNAGIFTGSSIHEMENKQWDEIFDLNISSVFRLTKRVLKPMMEQKNGNIINISSILGMIAVPQVAAYNASKGALIQFSRSLAVEYGSHGIRSNAICPGLIATEMTEGLMSDPKLMDEWKKDYPIGRFGVPEDVASACLYLASDESSFVTGIVLPVDGGFTAH